MDERKFKELVLYIADQCQRLDNYGSTLLCKILFFSDFFAYGKYGRSITGESYKKVANGPIPQHFYEIRDKLIESGDAVIQLKQTLVGTQHRLIPLREPDLTVFTPEDIAISDYVIGKLRTRNAQSVSGLSHKFYGWQITKTDEVIPYETIFLKEPKGKQTSKVAQKAIEALKEKYGPRSPAE